MRMKALGVALMVGFAAFTTFYWVTDAPRRESFEVVDTEELPEFGMLVFLPDDTYTIEVDLTDAGFAQADVALTEISLFVNTTISFKNLTGGELTVRGTGAREFEVVVEDTRTSPIKFDEEGETTVTAEGLDSTLLVTAGPPHLAPYGANCARCHGVGGLGSTLSDGTIVPPLRGSISLANKWLRTGGRQGLNNYVQWVITLGGVVRSGNIDSVMPAWGQEYGGSLTRQQIEALTALIGTWAEETLANPPPEEVPDTVEAGQEIYTNAGCAGCHGDDLAGTPGVYPNIQTIGSELVVDLPTPVAHLDQMQADYERSARAFLELWIRDSAANYNNGESTGMPPHSESSLGESQLRALITFLLAQTQ